MILSASAGGKVGFAGNSLFIILAANKNPDFSGFFVFASLYPARWRGALNYR